MLIAGTLTYCSNWFALHEVVRGWLSERALEQMIVFTSSDSPLIEDDSTPLSRAIFMEKEVSFFRALHQTCCDCCPEELSSMSHVLCLVYKSVRWLLST